MVSEGNALAEKTTARLALRSRNRDGRQPFEMMAQLLDNSGVDTSTLGLTQQRNQGDCLRHKVRTLNSWKGWCKLAFCFSEAIRTDQALN